MSMVIVILSLFTFWRTVLFAKDVYKEGNIPGAIGTAILAMVVLVSPIILIMNIR